jgi:DNA-binding SARP family transcriptional activator
MRATDAAGRSVLPRVRKTRAILALLAVVAPRPVLRVQLIALLWSSREAQHAKGSLRQALHELQDALVHWRRRRSTSAAPK